MKKSKTAEEFQIYYFKTNFKMTPDEFYRSSIGDKAGHVATLMKQYVTLCLELLGN